ncbi:MAG: 2-phosphosulfolactate phosphatase [Firmicutes bacterium]|nr:2-phosphosulfolactate phosphatase [Bacillota bacterium]
MKLDVAFLPQEIAENNLSDAVCIVLDIFRATTCIVTAFSNGCKTIIPVLSLVEAHRLAKQAGSVLLAGERQSIKMDGCDMGNSPFEFSRTKVADQTVIMTTSNGTAAVKATETAYCTLIGSFINAGAVCREARRYEKNIVIVCAGTDRTFSLEDALCAGLLVQTLTETGEMILTDSAAGALLMYQQAKSKILEIAGNSRNGQRLRELNRLNEITYCLQTDLFPIVPHYSAGKISLAGE